MSKIITIKTEFEVTDSQYDFFKKCYETYSVEDALSFLGVCKLKNKKIEIVVDNEKEAWYNRFIKEKRRYKK